MSFISALQAVNEVEDKSVTRPKDAREPDPRRGIPERRNNTRPHGAARRRPSELPNALTRSNAAWPPLTGHRVRLHEF